MARIPRRAPSRPDQQATSLKSKATVTPPIGLTFCVVSAVRPDIPLPAVFKGIARFHVADVLTIIALLAFPESVTRLRNLIRLERHHMKLATSLPLATAETILTAALEIGRREDMSPLTVVVLDSGGRMICMKSEDGSGLLRLDIALGKAYGALGMGISSRAISDLLAPRPAFQNAIAAASDGRFIPVPGGVLIEDAQGMTVGAVGISGDTSDRDEYAAIHAIRAAGHISNPAEENPD